MLLDLGIIASYFLIVLVIGLRSRVGKDVTPDQYFLSSRSLKWPSIAISTIATNIHAGHFIGMTGSAYLYGLAQANLEINAILGILIATLFFVPLFLKQRVTTITQFLERQTRTPGRAGILLVHDHLVRVLVHRLGALLGLLRHRRVVRRAPRAGGIRPALASFSLAVVLASFPPSYTYLGGLRAVVRTDVAQFICSLAV